MIEMVNALELLVQNNPPARQIDRNSLSVKFQVEMHLVFKQMFFKYTF